MAKMTLVIVVNFRFIAQAYREVQFSNCPMLPNVSKRLWVFCDHACPNPVKKIYTKIKIQKQIEPLTLVKWRAWLTILKLMMCQRCLDRQNKNTLRHIPAGIFARETTWAGYWIFLCVSTLIAVKMLSFLKGCGWS